MTPDQQKPFVSPGHCQVYGVIPVICRDFSPTSFCSDCGKTITLEEASTGGIMAVKCPACWSEWEDAAKQFDEVERKRDREEAQEV